MLLLQGRRISYFTILFTYVVQKFLVYIHLILTVLKKGNKCGYETSVAVNVLIDDGLSYIPNYTATFSTFTNSTFVN